MGRREPRPREPGELNRLEKESRRIDWFRRRPLHDDFLVDAGDRVEGGELEDVEVFGEDAGLVGEEGSMTCDAGSMQNSDSDASRRCLMRASRFRVVSEVHSDVELRSAGVVSGLG